MQHELQLRPLINVNIPERRKHCFRGDSPIATVNSVDLYDNVRSHMIEYHAAPYHILIDRTTWARFDFELATTSTEGGIPGIRVIVYRSYLAVYLFAVTLPPLPAHLHKTKKVASSLIPATTLV